MGHAYSHKEAFVAWADGGRSWVAGEERCFRRVSGGHTERLGVGSVGKLLLESRGEVKCGQQKE